MRGRRKLNKKRDRKVFARTARKYLKTTAFPGGTYK